MHSSLLAVKGCYEVLKNRNQHKDGYILKIAYFEVCFYFQCSVEKERKRPSC